MEGVSLKYLDDSLYQLCSTEAGPVGQINLGNLLSLHEQSNVSTTEHSEFNEWDWLAINPRCNPIFIPQDDIPNVFELVFVVCCYRFYLLV
jgi:hypothetical protein